MRSLRRCLLPVVLAVCAATATTVLHAPALAQADAYKAHMDNGVKLYEDRNYPAAIAEFEAAYKEKPKASPLINIALCHKAQFRYGKAIEMLELALSKHGDTMEQSDKSAAEDAIAEMKKLLAEVKLTVVPPDAKVTIDGEPHDASKPILLSPGAHKITGEVEGKPRVEQQIQVVSGEMKEITLNVSEGPATTTPVKPQPKGDERYSTPMMVIGVVAGGLGLLVGVGGIVTYGAAGTKNNFTCNSTDAEQRALCENPDKQRAAGLGLMIGGLIGLGVGIPMFIVGNGPPERPKQPPKAAGTLWVGPGRIGATVAF